jgi:iron complex transport system substrate-binding protein
MSRNRCFALLCLLLISLTSCYNKQTRAYQISPSDSLIPEFASGFTIKYFNDYKEVIVKNPWDKNITFARYYLVDNDTIQIPSDGVRIVTPVNKTAVSSSTHFEFLHLLNELDKVKGVCSPELIFNAFIRDEFSAGKIEDLGDAFNINVEKTLKLQPEILMMSGYKQDDPYAKRVIQAGTPVVYNNEWMENSLLARAEWIKFVAVFYNKEAQADSIFDFVKDQYLLVKSKAQSADRHPRIMTGSNFRGTCPEVKALWHNCLPMPEVIIIMPTIQQKEVCL